PLPSHLRRHPASERGPALPEANHDVGGFDDGIDLFALFQAQALRAALRDDGDYLHSIDQLDDHLRVHRSFRELLDTPLQHIARADLHGDLPSSLMNPLPGTFPSCFLRNCESTSDDLRALFDQESLQEGSMAMGLVFAVAAHGEIRL